MIASAPDMIAEITKHIAWLQRTAETHHYLAADAIAAAVVMWPETKAWIAERQDEAARLYGLAMWFRGALLDHASGNPDALECAYCQTL